MSKKYNFGFSLFEVVVTMAIVAIFVAACSNVFTQKYKKKTAIPPHGRMECYYDNAGQLTERMLSENVIISDTHPADGYCTFKPLSSSSYLIVNAVGGGGAGGQQYGGSKGEYQSLFLTTTTHTLHLYPGNPANVDATNPATFDPKAEDTYIADADDNDREILRVAGGLSNSGSNITLKSCSVSYAEYSCRLTPSCTIDAANNRVIVKYCNQNGEAYNLEKSINIDYSTILSEYSGTDTAELARGILVYRYYNTPAYLQDPVNYFALSIQLDGNFTQDEEPSDLEYYITGLEIKDGIALTSPRAGTGGAVGSKGGTGAVIIVW